MLTIKYQTAFKKDYKRIKKRGYDVRLLEKVDDFSAECQNFCAGKTAYDKAGTRTRFLTARPAVMTSLHVIYSPRLTAARTSKSRASKKFSPR